MAQTISAIQVEDPELAFLNPILEEWLLNIERYSRLVPGDASYWHTEACNCAVLGSAASRAGFGVLAEHTIKRREPGDPEHSQLRRGRMDLLIADESLDCIVEAKQCWPDKKSLVEWVLKKIGEAEKEVRSIERGITDRKLIRLAATFCGPCLNRKDAHLVDDLIVEYINAAAAIDCDARAWSFPARTRSTYPGDWHYPGIMIFVRKIAA